MAVNYLGTSISGLAADTKPTPSANERGLLFVETDTNKLYQWDTDSWNLLGSGADITITDNESTNENNLIAFIADAGTSTGTHGLEMDGNLTYNPSTGRITATQLAGTLQTAAQTNITSVGALNGGSITSGFGAIDVGSSAITTTGTITAGNLSVTGTTTTVNSTNTTISDRLIELASGAGDSTADAGIIVERGSTGNNAVIAWDESADSWTVGTTTATGASTGNLTIAAAPLVASTLTGTLLTAAQTNITSLGTLTALTGGTGDFIWDTDTLVVDSSADAVGIGTTTPSLTNGSVATLLDIEGDDAGIGLHATHGDGTDFALMSTYSGGIGQFWIYDADANAARMKLYDTGGIELVGNTGVGTGGEVIGTNFAGGTGDYNGSNIATLQIGKTASTATTRAFLLLQGTTDAAVIFGDSGEDANKKKFGFVFQNEVMDIGFIADSAKGINTGTGAIAIDTSSNVKFNNLVGIGNAPVTGYKAVAYNDSGNNQVRLSGDAASKYTLFAYRNLGSGSTATPVVYFTDDEANDDQPTLRVNQAGSGDIVQFYDGGSEVWSIANGGAVTQTVAGAGGDVYMHLNNSNGVTNTASSASLYMSATGTNTNNATLIQSDFVGTANTNHAQSLLFYPVGTSSARPSTPSLTIKHDGKIGIGINPTYLTHIYGAEAGEGTALGQLAIQSSTAFGSTPDAGIIFLNEHTSGSQAIMGGIKVTKSNTGDTDLDSTLTLQVRKHGAVAFNALTINEDAYTTLAGSLQIVADGYIAFGDTSHSIDVNAGYMLHNMPANEDYYWAHGGTNLMWLDTSAATLYVGFNDAVPGIIHALSGAAGQAEGGELRLGTAADYDATYNYYFLDAYQDDLRIGRAGLVDAYLRSTGTWQFMRDVLIDGDGKFLLLKGGVTGTKSGIAWTFNSDTNTNHYAEMQIDYDTRATLGLHMNVGYPITLDATTQINFDLAGTRHGALTAGVLSLQHATGAYLALTRADSSIADGNRLGTLLFRGDDPSASQNGAEITALADGTWSSGAYASEMLFKIHDGSSMLTPMTITSSSVEIAKDIELTDGSGTTIRTDGTYIRRDHGSGIIAIDSQGDVRINIDTNANGTNDFTIGGNGSTADVFKVVENGNTSIINTASGTFLDIGVALPGSGSTTYEGGMRIHASSGTDDRSWAMWADANNPRALRFEYSGARGTGFGSGTHIATFDYQGNVGIGEVTPDRKLHVLHNSSNAQVRIAHDASYYLDISEQQIEMVRANTSTGDLTIKTTNSGTWGSGGGDIILMPGGIAGGNFGDVGVGTAPYHINNYRFIHVHHDTNGGGMIMSDNSSRRAAIYNADANMYVDVTSTGHIAYRFNGTAPGGTEEFRMEADGDFHADGDVYAFSTTVGSDIALKENINVIDNALDKVSQLKGVSFDWKRKDRGSSVGLIAQDVEKVLPELVKETTALGGNDSHKNLNYNGIIGLLVESIKELKDEITELKNANSR